MNGLREILIENKKFRIFYVDCIHCDERILSLSELSIDALRTEAFLLHRMELHSTKTEHDTFDIGAEPQYSLERLDIRVNLSLDDFPETLSR